MNDRLYRSRDDRVLAGVCGGLAERYDADPSLVRLAFAILWLFTGIIPLTVIYVLAVIIVPEAPGSWSFAQGSGVPPTAGAQPAAGVPADAGAAPAAGAAGTEAAPGATPVTAEAPPADWYADRRAERHARIAARRAERARRGSDPLPAIVIGIVLVGVGAWLLFRDVLRIPWDIAWPAAIIALGVLLLILAFRPRAGGGTGQS